MAVLSDQRIDSYEELSRRCAALDTLGSLGSCAYVAMPAVQRMLFARVDVDCVLTLRVAAAAAAWRIDRCDIALPVLAWSLKDEYWGAAWRALPVLTEAGRAEVVPDLVWLAERRLQRGPFLFELLPGEAQREPLLALIARALGTCARGCDANGHTHRSEARAVLMKLAACDDERVRVEAVAATASLEDAARCLPDRDWTRQSRKFPVPDSE